MKKRVLSMLCAVMMLCCMAGTAMAAEMPETVPEEATPLTELLEQTTPEAAPTIYPAEVRASEENGIPRLEKVYYLTAKDDPASIPTGDFEREGRVYTLLDVLKNDQTETDTIDHIEVITQESKTKDMAEIIRFWSLNWKSALRTAIPASLRWTTPPSRWKRLGIRPAAVPSLLPAPILTSPTQMYL